MGDAVSLQNRERADLAPVRGFANQAFSRAAEAPLIGGNRIRLLINARENYPAWLEAIRGASAMSASRTTSFTKTMPAECLPRRSWRKPGRACECVSFTIGPS